MTILLEVPHARVWLTTDAPAHTHIAPAVDLISWLSDHYVSEDPAQRVVVLLGVVVDAGELADLFDVAGITYRAHRRAGYLLRLHAGTLGAVPYVHATDGRAVVQLAAVDVSAVGLPVAPVTAAGLRVATRSAPGGRA